MADDERKVSTVILEMDQKLNEALGYLKTIDNNYKLILDRLNGITRAASIPPPPAPSSRPPPPKPGLPSVESGEDFEFPSYDIKNNLKSKLARALEDAEQSQKEMDQPVVEHAPEGMKRNLRFYPDLQTKRVPIQQRLAYADGRGVPMANVEIFDKASVLVKQTKTNQQGKWLAALPVGTYKVNVSKMSTNLKPKVEASYDITVSSSDSVVELETKKV